MPYAYIVQNVPKLNFETVEEFGEIVYVLPEGLPINYENPQYLVELIRNELYDMTPDDYVVLTGPNHFLFGLLFATAVQATGGKVKLLRYEPYRQKYIESVVNLGEYDDAAEV